MTEDGELRGLGGWLILVGIGVVIGPVIMLSTFITAYKPIFEDGTWEALTAPGSEAYVPYFVPLIVGELVVNAILLAAAVLLIFLFFSKHYFFPKLYIGIVAASLIIIPLDAWLVTKVFPDVPMFDPDTTREFLRTLISGLIWVPYMLVSKRVRATFIDGRPNAGSQPAALQSR